VPACLLNTTEAVYKLKNNPKHLPLLILEEMLCWAIPRIQKYISTQRILKT